MTGYGTSFPIIAIFLELLDLTDPAPIPLTPPESLGAEENWALRFPP